MGGFLIDLFFRLTIFSSLVWASALAYSAGRCCHNPTVWTFKNSGRAPIKLTCILERSVAWAGDPIRMETETISPRGTFKYTWDTQWYSDGMGMLPGNWICRPTDNKLAKVLKPLKFTTDWGENKTLTWRSDRLTLSLGRAPGPKKK